MTTPPSAKDFPVAPAPVWIGLWMWIPLAGALALIVGANLSRFERTPMDLVITTAFVLLLAAAMSWAFFRRRIVLHADALEVVSTFYRKRVAVNVLDLEQARVVDLDEHPELKPALKINGFGMPGFRSGHYRMKDRRKAFCLVSDASGVVYLPLADGSVVLISPERPRELLEALKSSRASPALRAGDDARPGGRIG